jgi:circadian clock protein KaiB
VALTNLKEICEEHLKGHYEIEVIDLFVNPQLASGEQILAVPTLVRRLPEPNQKNHRRPLEQRNGSSWDWIYVNGDGISMALNARSLRAAAELAAQSAAAERYVLRLYITGMTPRSARAVRNLQAICDEYLEGRYDLEVIDIYQQPVLTKGEQIIAAPTLIKKLPLPMRRIIGDMSNRERVLLGLDLVRSIA